ncbi:MAG TPA: hypothetical protein VGM98_06390 [Schlesneria sp.]|jgi:hypothetical protein
MNTFLHSWRRKAGVVTLTMAVAFTGMWVRSTVVHDDIIPPTWTALDVGFISEKQSITCQTLGRARFCPLGAPLWQASSLPYRRSIDPAIVWQWEFGGFRYNCNSEIRCVVVPYWAFAIPLVMLSAYLLLWNPRKPSSHLQINRSVTARGTPQ